MNRSRLRAAAAAAVLLGLLLIPSTSAFAESCPLTVNPTSGPPGTRFTFSGSGYTPTQLRLTREGRPARVVPLQLQGADPFSFSIVASDADVGRWKAVATEAGGTCRGTATLQVTLPSTATADDPSAMDRTVVTMAVSGLGLVFVTVMLVMVRRSRRFGANA